ncbi:hypothetical protein SAMN05192534_106112 [Alteribacillus persepolensis]|uniref:Uncharacterized protein n=1 Tax=Alteribacillus persepolensis TaxID=568899 RepID=A0A1G8CXT7_9BACI|nr:hypothetical protein [Alteribacillus persepolensis]SDH49929.1 hypothetical protein SAMN05192534_106112 [Alteribacillus persepolensis]
MSYSKKEIWQEKVAYQLEQMELRIHALEETKEKDIVSLLQLTAREKNKRERFE